MDNTNNNEQLGFIEPDKPEDLAFARRMGYSEEEYIQRRKLIFKYSWDGGDTDGTILQQDS